MTTIQLTVPADANFVGLVRSSAAHAAAHANLDMDLIDDLKLAVDEAFALVIGLQSPSDSVTVTFAASDAGLEVVLTGPHGTPAPEVGTFAWTILRALVSEVSSSQNAAGQVTITMTSKASASA